MASRLPNPTQPLAFSEAPRSDLLPLRTGQRSSKPSAAQAPRHPVGHFPVLSTGDNRDFGTLAAVAAAAIAAAATAAACATAAAAAAAATAATAAACATAAAAAAALAAVAAAAAAIVWDVL